MLQARHGPGSRERAAPQARLFPARATGGTRLSGRGSHLERVGISLRDISRGTAAASRRLPAPAPRANCGKRDVWRSRARAGAGASLGGLGRPGGRRDPQVLSPLDTPRCRSRRAGTGRERVRTASGEGGPGRGGKTGDPASVQGRPLPLPVRSAQPPPPPARCGRAT